MNDKRRRQVKKLIKAIENLQSSFDEFKENFDIDELYSEAESIRDEEYDAYENLPDSIKESEKGQKMETSKESLMEAVDRLDIIKDSIVEITGNFEDCLSELNTAIEK